MSRHSPLADGADPLADSAVHLLSLDKVGKHYGNIIALRDVTMAVDNGRVTCVLGDNGAGKSTLIKIIAGLHQHDEGTLKIMGGERTLGSPREALDSGIAAVYQDLAVVSLMPIWRNFFLGSELTTGAGPFRRLDVQKMKDITKHELAEMGIDLRDVEQPIGQLSGGERQCVAIARAVYFGAKILILDEPTAALGVKQSGVVLRYILQARDRGLGVIFITHNPHHAFPVGDRFLLLKRGTSIGYYEKRDITLEELTAQMAGGAELAELAHELEQLGGHTQALKEVKAEAAAVHAEGSKA
jgi:simple sugar transport system ATP-binding protein